MTIAAPLAKNALAWLQDGIAMPTTLYEAGTWRVPGGVIFPTDPLGLWQAFEEPGIRVPTDAARIVGLLEESQDRTAILAFIWSHAPVFGGDDVCTIASVCGLAGFLTPEDVDAVQTYGDPEGTPYHGMYKDQLDAKLPTPPTLVSLPAGNRFPISGSGWGNGKYPVASLTDADGTMLALYTQFIGGGENWLLPPVREDKGPT
ncbi:hypothetical protein [Gymnodinialimonas hymeniacidonis]|uniref:hypothetical protein n=1 Tax=Gymnodinialimonas hymeniacidonis TaxID=3126508 RepID=UPI0034C6983E